MNGACTAKKKKKKWGLKLEDSVALGINDLISQRLCSHLENEDDNTDLGVLHVNKLQS